MQYQILSSLLEDESKFVEHDIYQYPKSQILQVLMKYENCYTFYNLCFINNFLNQLKHKNKVTFINSKDLTLNIYEYISLDSEMQYIICYVLMPII